jgi:PAS domain S-box-containing protein
MSGILKTIPREDVDRIWALLPAEILDAYADISLDEISALAARYCGAEYSCICLLHGKRLWYKSTFGYQPRERVGRVPVWYHAGKPGEPVIINEAYLDTRFPPTGIDLGLDRDGRDIVCQSFASVPLDIPGHNNLARLCLFSREPNRFNIGHLKVMSAFARQAVTRLELYARIRMQEQAMRSSKRMEHALLLERDFVSATLNNIRTLVIVLDTAGRVIRFNNTCEELTGYHFSDLAGRAFPEELFQGEDRQVLLDKLATVREGQMVEDFESRWQTSEGKTLRVCWNARPMLSPSGEIQFLLVTGEDVTLQYEAQEALKNSKASFHQLVENSLGLVCTHNLDGRILSLNPAFAEYLGYQQSEMTGHLLSEFLATGESTSLGFALDSLRSGREVIFELRMLQHDHADGEVPPTRTIRCRSRVMDLPGSAPFILMHALDATGSAEAEEMLHQLTRQRESILASVGEGIYGVTFDGKLSFINPAAAAMLGYRPEEMVGRDVHQLIHHSYPDGTPYPREACPIYKATTDGDNMKSLRILNEVFWRKDGTPLPVEYLANPLIYNGKLTGTVVAFQDVSEKNRLDRMKDEFISSVSHELRTPLTSLRGALGLLSGGVLRDRPEKAAQMLDVAIANCERLTKLVNDILNFEHVDKQALPIHRVESNVLDMLRRVADINQAAADHAGVRLRLDAEHLTVWADPELIVQALDHLLGNAIKFSAPGQYVRMAAITSPDNSDEVLFEIEDRGRGIPAEQLQIIFDRFRQGDSSDTRTSGGTGLGLALCRSILDQHGTQIQVHSEKGKGSCFSFTLPRHA